MARAAGLGIGLAMLAACAGGDGSGATGTEAPAQGAGTGTPASEPGSPAADTELVDFTIAASLVDAIPYMTMLQVAVDKGWFEEEGLNASVISAGGGGDTTRILTAGEADLGIAGPDAILAAASQESSNIQIIGGWFGINIVAWVGDEPDQDLQGVSLGVTGAGSTGELMAKAIQAARPDLGIEIVVVGGLGDNFTAMQAGEIDGAYTADPFKTQQVQEQGAHVLVEAREIIGDMPNNLVAVNRDFASENPEAVEAFWRVAERAYTYLREDTETAVQDLAEYIEMDPEILTESIRNTPRFEEAWTIAVPCESFENLSEQFMAAGVIDEPVDWNAVMDQQYLPEDARCDFG